MEILKSNIKLEQKPEVFLEEMKLNVLAGLGCQQKRRTVEGMKGLADLQEDCRRVSSFLRNSTEFMYYSMHLFDNGVTLFKDKLMIIIYIYI